MLPPTFYHVSKEQHLHKGKSKDCRLCNKSVKTTQIEKSKSNGSAGGKKNKTTTARVCSVCGVKIDRKNKSGLCITCFNERRRVQQKGPAIGPRVCSIKGCNTSLSVVNQSGLCASCFRKSEHWKQQTERVAEKADA
jgi:hypothetical protein